MLVANSSHDQVAGSAEQGRIFFNALKAPKTFLEFDTSQGGQFHCQLGAPLLSSERLLNWLDERAKTVNHEGLNVMKSVWKPFGAVLFVCMLQVCVLSCAWAGDCKGF